MVSMLLKFLLAITAASSFVTAVPTAKLVERKSSNEIYPEKMIIVQEQFPDEQFGPGDKGFATGVLGKGDGVTTLLSFTIPSGSTTNMCRYIFRNPDKLEGTPGFTHGIVYAVNGDIPNDATFSNRPKRGVALATFSALPKGDSKFLSGSTFICSPGKTLNYEIGTPGDYSSIAWTKPNGLTIEYNVPFSLPALLPGQ